MTLENGRLKTVTSGTNSVEYFYWPNSSLLSNVVFKSGGSTRMTTSRTYDGFNRLTGISSVCSGSSVVGFACAYNQANQRVAATNGSSETYTKEVGHVFVPPASQTLSSIQEGCLYSDGRWYYRWDAENRLVKMTAASVYVGYPYQELRFTHDWMSRRISKVVSNKVGGVWHLETSRKFLYDGWNLVAELDGSNVLQRTHVWGLDASGTMHGAGGVGGLLATIIPEGLPNAGVYFPAYDGNHNVVAYLSAATGAIVAEYDYGPFGELLRATGPLAKDFNFLFSTKYYDWETGLYYYGYRYYNPNIGRWLSRDPIEEQGGANLYGFVGNEPMKHYDVLGLLPPIDGIPNGRSDLPYDQFEKYLEDYVLGRRLLPGEKSQIERGCVGQCSVIQRVSIGAKYIQVWPENAKNTRCFRTQAEAEASKCKDGKQPFVFAKQGVAWKDGSKNGPKGYQPEPGKPANPSKELGEVPIDSVLPNAGVAGVPFNYIAVCHVKGKDGKVHKVYTWMNYAKQHSGSEGRVSDYPYPGDDTYKVTMWCRTCPE